MADKTKRYAEISWCALDLSDLRPSWTAEKCDEFLEENEDAIQLAMIEAGVDAIRELMPTEEDE
jgi:hypothetical protein